nr:piggyBac transposable element-derived protein 4-like [Megalopta genalis]
MDLWLVLPLRQINSLQFLAPCRQKFSLALSVKMSVRECESNSSSEIIFARKRLRLDVFLSSDEEEEEIVEEWHDPRGNQPKIVPFTHPSGFIRELIGSDIAVQTSYQLFVPDELMEEIAEQTNIYAAQKIEAGYTQRLAKWTETSKSEIKRLLGLVLWMGLVKLPAIHHYWSNDPAYLQTFPRAVMSRNRFELLLRMLHFADNKNDNGSNRLYKIQPIIDILETNYKKYYNPTEDICIDESLIPFRGRIVFRQYLKQKRHKYGIKIFKLCCGSGYTYAFRDILVLSTKHSSEMVNVECRSGRQIKPQIIVDYNRQKSAVDLSDQMNAYNNPLRKSLKWYRKLAFELLLNTTVQSILQVVTKKTFHRAELQEDPEKKHKLERKSGKVSEVRKYCKLCYDKNVRKDGRVMARRKTKRVVTFCNTCKGKPFLCLPCYNESH